MRYPEIGAGGYSRVDGVVAFYGRVQALLGEVEGSSTIVDFGAGRGRQAEDAVAHRRALRELRAPGRTVIGVDVDPVVTSNPRVDEGRVIGPDGRLPLADGEADLVVSEWTLEHIEDPVPVVAELGRVLAPGGWFCAMTPNKWGYIGVGARLVPNRMHVGALRTLQPGKKDVDTFPTHYRMNTGRDLRRLFAPPQWSLHAYTMDAEPHLYGGGRRALTGALAAMHHLPGPLKTVWMVFARKLG